MSYNLATGSVYRGLMKRNATGDGLVQLRLCSNGVVTASCSFDEGSIGMMESDRLPVWRSWLRRDQYLKGYVRHKFYHFHIKWPFQSGFLCKRTYFIRCCLSGWDIESRTTFSPQGNLQGHFHRCYGTKGHICHIQSILALYSCDHRPGTDCKITVRGPLPSFFQTLPSPLLDDR